MLLLALAALVNVLPAQADAFVHPGILHTQADLNRMRDGVKAHQSPIFDGFEVFQASAPSQATYVMRGPFPEIGRNPTMHFSEFDGDANAAYQCALMWTIKGNQAYADKSKQIINSWAATLKTVSGADAVLMAGLGPFKMVNAAEILRYTHAGWSDAEIIQSEKMFKTVLYPTLKDFALFANGNWDTAAIKTVMAIGIFCNDRPMFERALRYYVHGAGDGRLTHYIYANGECQESGRDQAHTQLGLAHLGDCCEIAWNQGLDLYSYNDNRLLTGFEYTAKYNLGNDVDFTPDLDRTGKYAHRVISVRGPFRPVYEQIYNHYVQRKGLSAPFTQQVVEKIRPEGAAQGADHPGYGTLLYTRPTGFVWQGHPAAPGGLIAQGTSEAITLSWVASVGATSYTIKRSVSNTDRYSTIAKNIAATSYQDTKVKSSVVYTYVVSASNAAGQSPDALAVSASAGLPTGWSHQDIGAVGVPGAALYDGSVFTLEASGMNISGTSDQFHGAFVPLNGDGTITARFVPQVSSQFSKFGLMIRDALTPEAANVSLLLTPASGTNIEAPGWKGQLLARTAADGDTSIVGSSDNLAAPVVTYGRLKEPYWLRLTRTGNSITGAMSPDGQTWTSIGTATVPFKSTLLVGLCACSGLAKVTTMLMFDTVIVSPQK